MAPLCRALIAERDPGLRDAAAAALVRLGEPAVVPLGDVLRHADAEARWRASVALGQIGDVRALPPLCQALTDVNWRVRLEAAEALGRIGDARAIQPLVEALKHRGWEMRQRVAQALEKLDDDAAIEPLCAALRDEDAVVRWRAAQLLGQRCDRRAVLPLLRNAAPLPHAEAGERAVPPLCDALHDDDARVRSMAIEALGKIRDPRAAPPLLELLRHPDWGTRRQAVVALEEIGPAAVPAVCDALRHADSHVRDQAALLLARIGDGRAVLPLCDAFDRGQTLAATALGEIAQRDPVPELATAVPLLFQRLEMSRWTQPPLTIALEQIERALAGTLRLPVPAAAPLPAVEELPVPAAPPSTRPDSLPIPTAPSHTAPAECAAASALAHALPPQEWQQDQNQAGGWLRRLRSRVGERLTRVSGRVVRRR